VGRRSAADVLAGMLDLQASVRLADFLGTADRHAADAIFRAPLLLGDYVRQRLAAIEDSTCRRLDRPFEGVRIRVPDPLQTMAQVVASGATASASEGRAFAGAMWRLYRDHLLGCVSRARAEVAALRDEVTHDLRDASARGARLEGLDAVLRGALNDAVPTLCERLAVAMEVPFVEALAAAVARLPETVEAAAMAPWFEERGVLGAQLARTREITRALLRHEARSLATLVEASFDGGGT
jgi:hypothetical protein